MELTPGTKLGPYEIVSPIGAGGMGEVFKARDTRLDRTVAIKVMPKYIAAREDLRARFEREARTVSSLNHPNICVLYDIGKQDGTDFMVLEFLEGETLGGRIAKGPMPLDQVLKYATQIADALDRAHRSGVSHRDVKPANVMITRDGCKVLDFGLAKSAPKTIAPGDETLTAALTSEGTILGTPQYMAPEQYEGREADARSDIFAFGCVLYEMVTGKRSFDGKTRASLIAAVLAAEPAPMRTLIPVTPAALERIVSRCLEKDPEDRYQSMRDVVLDLRSVGQAGIEVKETRLAPRVQFVPWVAAGFVAVAAAALAFVHFREVPVSIPVVRFELNTPGNVTQGPLEFAVSPDGRRIVFHAVRDDKSPLSVRSLDTLAAQPLAGTEGATSPFWSPDSRFIAFFANGKLKKIDAGGGPPTTLADASFSIGGAWSRRDVILFNADRRGALQHISASGGGSSPASRLDAGRAEISNDLPAFLPDGSHFLFAAPSGTGNRVTIRIGSLDSLDSKVLMEADSQAIYSDGYLLYLRESSLMAQAFDAKSLSTAGDAIPIAEKIGHPYRSGGFGSFSVSENGVLLYRQGQDVIEKMAWFDRIGTQLGPVGEPGSSGEFRMSRDGRNVAMVVNDPASGKSDIWILELARGLRTRFTFSRTSERAPIWSPDGNFIVFSSSRNGHSDLYRKAVDGAPGSEQLLLADGLAKSADSWSPDGKYLLYQTSGDPKTHEDLWVVPMTGEAKPMPFANTEFSEAAGAFSPDGRWIAYVSDESGTAEIYAAPFPGPGRKVRISQKQGQPGAGGVPNWAPNGKEIFYIAPNRDLTAVPVSIHGDTLEAGAPHKLFGPILGVGGHAYEISPDGQRILTYMPPDAGEATPITVVQNWIAGLKK